MQDLDPRVRPAAPDRLQPDELTGDWELAALAALARAGVPLAPMVVVPAAAEERFYRLNNLPARLLEIFADVDAADPDEDDVEEAAPEAVALVRQHYLLDEFIDAFYESVAALPDRVRVRRSAHTGTEGAPAGGAEDGEVAARGRPALLALKHAFQWDWGAAAVMRRIAASGSIALEARAVVLQPAEDRPAPEVLLRRAAEVLGRPVRLWVAEGGGVSRVAPSP